MNNLKRENTCFITRHARRVLTLLMSLGIGTSAMAQSFPETVPLPDSFQPEGITLGIGHTAYVGSLLSGAIYEVDLVGHSRSSSRRSQHAGNGIAGLYASSRPRF